MTNTDEKIFITASPNIITRASRLFDNSLDTALGELLQNSRRAGATKVEIRYIEGDPSRIEYCDDGPGIFRQGFNILLGGSNWAPEDINTEDAAGMGIFSLCRRNPKITANGIQVSLTEDHFNGLRPVDLEKVPERGGTSIEFSVEVSRASAKSAVLNAALYFPLPVTYDWDPVGQKPFIGNPLEEWEGMTLGLDQDVSGRGTLLVNFYGHVVREHLTPNPVLDNSEYRCLRALLPGTAIRADVHPGCKIQMVLPDRKFLVRNELIERLVIKGLKLQAEKIASAPHHFSYEVFCGTKALLGVDIGEAARQLQPLNPYEKDLEAEFLAVSTEGPYFVVDGNCPSPGEMALAYPDSHLFEACPKYRGYGWYDAAPKINDFEVLIEGVSYKASKIVGAHELDEGEDTSEYFVLEENGITVVKDLQIVVPQLGTEPVSIPVLTWGDEKISYFSDLGSDYRENLGVLINAEASIHKVVEWLGLLVFEPNRDTWTSDDEQKERFDEEAYSYLGNLLEKQEEAARAVLFSLWNERLKFILPASCTITLKSDENKKLEIEIQKHSGN